MTGFSQQALFRTGFDVLPGFSSVNKRLGRPFACIIPSAFAGVSSSRFTLSRSDVLEIRRDSGEDVRREVGLDSALEERSRSFSPLSLSCSSLSLCRGEVFVTETDRLVNERTDPASTASRAPSVLSTASWKESCSAPCKLLAYVHLLACHCFIQLAGGITKNKQAVGRDCHTRSGLEVPADDGLGFCSSW
jgi:hypothetical protein